MSVQILLIGIMVLLFIGLITVLISLHKIGYTLNVILQVVSI